MDLITGDSNSETSAPPTTECVPSSLRPATDPISRGAPSSSSFCPFPFNCDLLVVCLNAVREASSGGGQSSSARCHRAAHFFLFVRSAGCCLWALRLRILSAAGGVVVG
ncbi:hypothetical protein Q8A73_004833 [Channa argus]|nr:hypothetical protein Q8A73_004833 [Channa argus]